MQQLILLADYGYIESAALLDKLLVSFGLYAHNTLIPTADMIPVVSMPKCNKHDIDLCTQTSNFEFPSQASISRVEGNENRITRCDGVN